MVVPGDRAVSYERGTPVQGSLESPLGPSQISHRHETDKSDNRIIGPRLIEPVMVELITQPCRLAQHQHLRRGGCFLRARYPCKTQSAAQAGSASASSEEEEEDDDELEEEGSDDELLPSGKMARPGSVFCLPREGDPFVAGQRVDAGAPEEGRRFLHARRTLTTAAHDPHDYAMPATNTLAGGGEASPPAGDEPFALHAPIQWAI